MLCLIAIALTSIKVPPEAMARGNGLFFILGNAFFEGTGMFVILIFCCTTGNKLVAGEIDRGVMSFTMNTPTTRRELILSKALFHLGAVLGMIVVTSVMFTIGFAAFHQDISYAKFWQVVVGMCAYFVTVGGIVFFASCWFNKSSYSLLVGIGVPMLFYLLRTVSSIVSSMDFLKYLSINTLYDVNGITEGTANPAQWACKVVALFVMGGCFYVAGVIKFLRKDLPL